MNSQIIAWFKGRDETLCFRNHPFSWRHINRQFISPGKEKVPFRSVPAKESHKISQDPLFHNEELVYNFYGDGYHPFILFPLYVEDLKLSIKFPCRETLATQNESLFVFAAEVFTIHM